MSRALRNSRPTPFVETMTASAALSRLAERMRLSNACFAAVRPALPARLAPALRPGPYDETGWSILAGNAAVAAKLRQLVPRLESALAAAGLPVATIRVKVVG